jgi:hypothetical protein
VDQWQREFVKLVLNRPAISRTSGRRTWLRVVRITEGDSSAGGSQTFDKKPVKIKVKKKW